MSLDKFVAERRRFARLLGTADSPGSGLPVGPSAGADAASEPAAGGARADTAGAAADEPVADGTGGSAGEREDYSTTRDQQERADDEVDQD